MQFKPVTLARRTAATPPVTWVDAIRNVRLTSTPAVRCVQIPVVRQRLSEPVKSTKSFTPSSQRRCDFSRSSFS
jgi:hypothetical protein